MGSSLVRKMFKFEELRVYQYGLRFVDLVYRLTNKWPKDEIFGLSNQFRRAAVSVVLNIAEGTSRTKKDFRHFLDLARGSCYECVVVLAIVKERNYISSEEYKECYESCDKLSRMISALKTSLR